MFKEIKYNNFYKEVSMKNYRMIIPALIISMGCASLGAISGIGASIAEALKGKTFMISPTMKKSWQDLAVRKFDLMAKEFESSAQGIQDPATKKRYQDFAENLKKVAQKFKELHVPTVPVAHSMQYAPQWNALKMEKRALKERMFKEVPGSAQSDTITLPAPLVKAWHDLGARKLDLKAQEFDALAQDNKEHPIMVKQSQELASQLRSLAQELKSLPVPSTGITKSMKSAPEWKALAIDRLTLRAKQLHEIADQIQARLAAQGKALQGVAATIEEIDVVS